VKAFVVSAPALMKTSAPLIGLYAWSTTLPVTTTVSYTDADLVKWAGQLGYDINSCLKSEKYSDEVYKDQADGGKAGVRGTPAFFINGKLLSGAQPFSAFKSAIDAEL